MTQTASPSSAAAPCQPQSRSDLFWSFNWLALQGFGGVLAVAQRELVEKKRWLTREQFVEDWAVAQILPGPNVMNLSLMIGERSFGLTGALAAFTGMVAVPLLLILLMAIAFANVADYPAVAGALRGMGAVAAGLIAATGLKLVNALSTNVMGRAACWLVMCATFIGMAWLRLPLIGVLLSVGGLACLWAWRCLGQLNEQQA